MKKIIISIAALIFTAIAYAQSADEITKIINAEEATFGQVCYLTAVHNGLIEDDASEADAMNAWFESNQFINKEITPDTPINFQETCFYFTKMWNIKGNLFYKLSKGNPRYAYKQLKKDGILPAHADPIRKLSGTDLLNIYTVGHLKYVGNMEAAE